MFKEIGQIAGLMKNLPKIREEMDKLQGKLALDIVEGDAGGGMVKIKVNGHQEVVACVLTDEAYKLGDRELLEDLIVAATNQALKKVKQQVAEETSKMATGLGLPPGMNLPGLG
jgi:DNA-binding YbaB/EbfC family protein